MQFCTWWEEKFDIVPGGDFCSIYCTLESDEISISKSDRSWICIFRAL